MELHPGSGVLVLVREDDKSPLATADAAAAALQLHIAIEPIDIFIENKISMLFSVELSKKARKIANDAYLEEGLVRLLK